MFESALDKENLSWEEPLLDDSGDFPDAHSSEIAELGRRGHPVNDDGDLPVSEPSVTENEDQSEDETQVEVSDLVTERARDIVRDQLRRRLTSKQPPSTRYGPEPSIEEEERMQSTLKKARVDVSELLHDALLVNAARVKEKQWHGLNGHEKLLFLEAVSKPWNAWQENAAATVIPPAEARVIWRTVKKTRSARSRDAVAVCAR